MAIPDTLESDTLDIFRKNENQTNVNVGDLTLLNTVDKINPINAINEVNNKTGKALSIVLSIALGGR